MSQVLIQPLHPCLVALQTATGAVTLLVTRHPASQIAHLGTQLEIERRMVVTTAHAERISAELRAQFADKAVSAWGGQPYYLVDWEAVEAAIADFDFATGRRHRLGDVAVGDRVQVELATLGNPQEKRRGEVSSISGCRYLVRLLEPLGEPTGVWAPRSQIKPIVRCCGLVGEAA